MRRPFFPAPMAPVILFQLFLVRFISCFDCSRELEMVLIYYFNFFPLNMRKFVVKGRVLGNEWHEILLHLCFDSGGGGFSISPSYTSSIQLMFIELCDVRAGSLCTKPSSNGLAMKMTQSPNMFLLVELPERWPAKRCPLSILTVRFKKEDVCVCGLAIRRDIDPKRLWTAGTTHQISIVW